MKNIEEETTEDHESPWLNFEKKDGDDWIQMCSNSTMNIDEWHVVFLHRVKIYSTMKLFLHHHHHHHYQYHLCYEKDIDLFCLLIFISPLNIISKIKALSFDFLLIDKFNIHSQSPTIDRSIGRSVFTWPTAFSLEIHHCLILMVLSMNQSYWNSDSIVNELVLAMSSSSMFLYLVVFDNHTKLKMLTMMVRITNKIHWLFYNILHDFERPNGKRNSYLVERRRSLAYWQQSSWVN